MSSQNRKYTSLEDFLTDCRRAMRVRRLSIHTERSYLSHIECFIRFHRRQPQDMNAEHVEQYLTYLAVEKDVAA
ncbi:MAG: phage integrase N-terminal SAM-like domain-containing protein [Armatimonadota bacterium]|nr:phage integrase N-terminal SAM-like domain-containing protein [Armatimonadota bacterium]